MDNLLKDAVFYWEVAKHLKTWVTNLRRAKEDRKKESVEALRQVIIASRGMRIYINEWNEGVRDYSREKQLSEEWTTLGFLVRDLGLKDLSAKCDALAVKLTMIDQVSKETIEKTREALVSIEERAQDILVPIEADR